MTTKDRKRSEAKWWHIYLNISSREGTINPTFTFCLRLLKLHQVSHYNLIFYSTFILSEELSSHEESEIRGHFLPPRPDTFDESVLFDVIVVVVVLASQVT